MAKESEIPHKAYLSKSTDDNGKVMWRAVYQEQPLNKDGTRAEAEAAFAKVKIVPTAIWDGDISTFEPLPQASTLSIPPLPKLEKTNQSVQFSSFPSKKPLKSSSSSRSTAAYIRYPNIWE